MANEVFFFDSTDVGAPTLNNAAGSMVAVLDACLVDGFNSKSVTSIVVASNVATVTCSSHGFVAVPGKHVLIAGATPSALNGIKLLTSAANANTFTFAAPGVSNQTATGTITARRAPIGWGRPFSGTNKAVYRSADVTGTRLYMRIDDTNSSPATATDARVVMYETMSDVDTGTGPCPTVAQVAGGQFWNKGTNNATAKTWTLIGDGRIFYFFTQVTSTVQHYPHGFGDLVSYRAADSYGCVLIGGAAAWAGVNTGTAPFSIVQTLGDTPVNSGYVIARIASGTGSCVRVNNIGFGIDNVVWGSTNLPEYPSPVDNGIVMSRPIYVAEENSAFNNPIRGELPGAIVPLAVTTSFNHLDLITGITGLTGTALVVSSSTGSQNGKLFFDISNDWRT
jgi:hypothetical protein